MIRTTISIPKILLEQAENVAQQLNISRNRLFGLAIETYVKNYQNQVLLDEINQAYSDEPDPSEKVRLSKMRKNIVALWKVNGNQDGKLPERRVRQILDGIYLLIAPCDLE